MINRPEMTIEIHHLEALRAVAYCDENGLYDAGDWEITIDVPTEEERRAAKTILTLYESKVKDEWSVMKASQAG